MLLLYLTWQLPVGAVQSCFIEELPFKNQKAPSVVERSRMLQRV